MCGRYSFALRKDEVAAALGLDPSALPDEIYPRYNIAPGQMAVVGIPEAAGCRLVHARWGIRTSRSVASGVAPLINIRAESVLAGRPVGRWLAGRRCAVPASGFFEWSARGRVRQPWYFSRADGRPFVFAGFWAPAAPDGAIEYAIATTRPNSVVARVHDRMPVILTDERLSEWLDPAIASADRVPGWAEPFPAEVMQSWPVSRRVGDVRTDDPSCIAPLAGMTEGDEADLFDGHRCPYRRHVPPCS